MDYVKDSKGTTFIGGRYQVRAAARSFEDTGFTIYKRLTMEGNDYKMMPGEFYKDEGEAFRRVKQMMEEER